MAKSRVSIGTQADAKELLEILSGGGVHSVEDLADEMNRSKDRIRRVVSRIRKRFNEGDKDFDSWVYSTVGGYSLEEKAEHAAYETRMRLQMGMGVIMNGVHPMRVMKKLLPKQFSQLTIEYKPKMIAMGKVIK